MIKLGRNHGLDPNRIATIIEEVEDAVPGWQRFAKAAQVEGSLANVAEPIASVRATFD